MGKNLTDDELGNIIERAVKDYGVIDCADSYGYFLEDLGELITKHFGGICDKVEYVSGKWLIAFTVNDCVPEDGGIYKDYDAGTIWKDGREIA